MINEKKIIRVSLVVQLIDEFTDQLVSGQGIELSIDGESKPVRKSEGYYVFTNLKATQAVLRFSSPIYQGEMVELDLLPEQFCMVKLRIRPNRNYSFPSGTTILEGEAEKGSLVMYYQKEGKECLKLLFDAETKGKNPLEKLSIYNPENKNLDGRIFVISNEEEKKEELIQIREQSIQKEQEYLLMEPLRNSYKKLGTKIFPVSTSKTDEQGRFLLPIRYAQRISPNGIFEIRGKKKVKKSVSLVEGQCNWMK